MRCIAISKAGPLALVSLLAAACVAPAGSSIAVTDDSGVLPSQTSGGAGATSSSGSGSNADGGGSLSSTAGIGGSDASANTGGAGAGAGGSTAGVGGSASSTNASSTAGAGGAGGGDPTTASSGSAGGGSATGGGSSSSASGSSTTSSSSGGASTGGGASDVDGDGIPDSLEGNGTVDTDGDGTPDSSDTDSDDDGIPDQVENPSGLLDTDSDGTPDFRDLDSDGNGILDATEPPGDLDGDGKQDVRDLDDDGDLVGDLDEILAAKSDCNDDHSEDAHGTAQAPADCDADGLPNYRDVDSDGDTILDLREGGSTDSDKDGALDRFDHDSDADGFLDSVEAGDANPSTPAVDTDADARPDYRDPDSDNDGLSDLEEAGLGTSRTSADTDSDGTTDLVEVAAGTNPLDASDNPHARGNFVFVVPYQGASSPTQDTLQFRTSVQYADVYFSFDQTGSMVEELDAMRDSVPAMIEQLRCKADAANTVCESDDGCPAGYVCFERACVNDPISANGGAGCIPDMWTGVGRFDGCDSYQNLVSLQDKAAVTAHAIPLYTCDGFLSCDQLPGADIFDDSYCLDFGSIPSDAATCQVDADCSVGTCHEVGAAGGKRCLQNCVGWNVSGSEAVLQSAACVANEALCDGNNGCGADPNNANPVGCPGFRSDAVRVLVQITDADNQGGTCGGTVPSVSAAGSALGSTDIKFVGLVGDDDDGAGTLCTTPLLCANGLGTSSGTVKQSGAPFVYQALDAGVVEATKAGILEIVRGVPMRVTIRSADDAADAVDATQFIEHLQVNLNSTGCTNVSPVADENSDGHNDMFPALLGGTRVCWDVVPVATNTTVAPTNEPQVFRATLTVSGDGSPLDSRAVYFLVPPRPAQLP